MANDRIGYLGFELSEFSPITERDRLKERYELDAIRNAWIRAFGYNEFSKLAWSIFVPKIEPWSDRTIQFLKTPIKELGLSKYAKHALITINKLTYSYQIMEIGSYYNYQDSGLRGFGTHSKQELNYCLSEYGLKMGVKIDLELINFVKHQIKKNKRE